ncbi:transcription elongation factor GreAB [Litoribrevibacter euphylliae]|uniref:Transcription elongation factor GreAB n=1 Tax=Litoribrevibacter euphylliae TaxID=1834034 RepID=A0ABV7HK02_9GAMM
MNKELIRHAILSQLENQHALAVKSANEARDLATHEQSQPETQYDTVGLEASYLAHGQSQRVFDLDAMIQRYRNMTLRNFTSDDEIALSAYVELAYPDDTTKAFFIGPCAGGLELLIEEQKVHLITPDAPLARCMMGAYDGDEFELPGSNQTVEVVRIS